MKIVSGGQNGSDRAALGAAMESSIEVGGWKGDSPGCPPINTSYPLKELAGVSNDPTIYDLARELMTQILKQA